MLNVLLALAVIALPAEPTVDVTKIFTISENGQNIYAQIAYSPQSRSFLVAWFHASELMKYEKTRINAALLSARKQIKLKKTLRISRAGKKKTEAPHVAITYHPKLKQFLIIWQEITKKENRLLLDTLDSKANFVNRLTSLENSKGILVARPILAVDAQTELATAFWNNYYQDGLATIIYSFDPLKPRSPDNQRNQLLWQSDRYELIQAVVPNVQAFQALSCLIDGSSGYCLKINSRNVSVPSAAIDTPWNIVHKKVRRTLTVSAAATAENEDEQKTMVLFNRTNNNYKKSILSFLLVDEEAKQTSNPVELTTKSEFVHDAVILPASADGLARVLWTQLSDGQYSLRLGALHETGCFVGKIEVIRSSQRAITCPVTAYNADKTKLLIVWSEDYPDGSVRLLARAVELF